MSLSRMLTEIIPIKDLYAENAEMRDGHQKYLTILGSSSAIVSMISSSTLIWMIFRSRERLTTTRHRILFGMAVGDIIYSLSLASYNAIVPSDEDYYTWNAHGSQTTCTVSGLMTIVGSIMSCLYSCSLNIYSLAIVKYNKTDSYIRNKMEPFLHAVPIVMSLVFGFAQLAARGYNSMGGICIASVYEPPHCHGIDDGEVREGFEIPCGRGGGGLSSTIIFNVAFSFVVFWSPATTSVTLGMMYRHVSRQERRMGRYGERALNHSAPQDNNNTPAAVSADESNGINNMMRSIATSASRTFGRLSSRSNSNRNNSTSRVVMVRARAYTIAFLLTYSWFTVAFVVDIVRIEHPLAILYLMNFFTPLQGFWNLIIFMYPKVMKAKRSRGGNLSWCQATTEAFCPVINRWRERRTAKNNGREIPQEEEEIPADQEQHDGMDLVASSPLHGVRPGSEEEKT